MKKQAIEDIINLLLGYREELHNRISDAEINDSTKKGLIAGLDKSIMYGRFMLKNYQHREAQLADRKRHYDRVESELESNYKQKRISKVVYDKGKKDLEAYKKEIDSALESF